MEPYEQKTPGERGNGIMRTEAGAPSPIWLEQAAAELETKFHTLYISLCGNPQIMKLYESNWSIGTMFYMYSATNLPLDQLKTSFHQHKEILNTLKAKDEAALQKIIEEHMSIGILRQPSTDSHKD